MKRMLIGSIALALLFAPWVLPINLGSNDHSPNCGDTDHRGL